MVSGLGTWVGEEAGWGTSSAPTLDWAFLLPNPDCSLGSCVPFLSWRLHSGTSPAFFFFLNRPGSLLGDIGVCEDWSPSTKGVPIKAEQMGEAGEVDRGSGQDAFHRADAFHRGSFTEQEGGGTGHKDGALEHKDRGSPWASLAGCLATVGNHLSGPQGSQGGPLLSVA